MEFLGGTSTMTKLGGLSLYLSPNLLALPEYQQYKKCSGKSALCLLDIHPDPEDALNKYNELLKRSNEINQTIQKNENLYGKIQQLNGGEDWQKSYTTEQDQVALTDVQKKLNSKLGTLSEEYNDRIDILHTNNNTLDTAQKYMNLKNKKLRNQLKQIYDMEDNIRTKQKLVNINTDHFRNQKIIISCLKASLILLPVVALFILAYLYGRISLPVMMGIVVTIVILYGIYVWYKITEARKPAWQRDSIKKDFVKVGNTIYHEGRKLEKEFIDENCDCPPRHKKDKPDHMKPGPGSNDPLNNGPPLLYNDGSSPTQVIYPNIKSKQDSIRLNTVDERDCDPAKEDCKMWQKLDWESRPNCSYNEEECGKPGNPSCCLNKKINDPYKPVSSWTAGL